MHFAFAMAWEGSNNHLERPLFPESRVFFFVFWDETEDTKKERRERKRKSEKEEGVKKK